jgi:ABC-type uncharacterized transport system permease subunit
MVVVTAVELVAATDCIIIGFAAGAIILPTINNNMVVVIVGDNVLRIILFPFIRY